MPLSRQLALCAMAGLLGCADATAPGAVALRVQFAATPLASQPDSALVHYRFVVTNQGDETIWLPRCDFRVRPDVALLRDGVVQDTWLGSACLAIYDMTPAPLPPGATYSADAVVPSAAGVRYQPSLVVGRNASMSGSATLVASPFAIR